MRKLWNQAYPQQPAVVLCCALAVSLVGLPACISRVQVLQSAPAVPYRTLGMVSGHGPNDASATQQAMEQASEISADAILVIETKSLGKQRVVRAEAIRYTGPQGATEQGTTESP